MTECVDEGLLMAYLVEQRAADGAERAAVEAHLAGCGSCRARLEELRGLEASVIGRMAIAAPARPPDIQAALVQMRLKLREEPVEAATNATNKNVTGMGASAARSAPPEKRDRRRIMETLSFIRPRQRRALFSGLTAAMLVLSMVVFPSVRAAADSLLQSFRAKSVLFLPVDTDRLRQLASLSADPTALFITKPSIVGEEKSRAVSSVDEAAGPVGFKPEQA